MVCKVCVVLTNSPITARRLENMVAPLTDTSKYSGKPAGLLVEWVYVYTPLAGSVARTALVACAMLRIRAQNAGRGST